MFSGQLIVGMQLTVVSLLVIAGIFAWRFARCMRARRQRAERKTRNYNTFNTLKRHALDACLDGQRSNSLPDLTVLWKRLDSIQTPDACRPEEQKTELKSRMDVIMSPGRVSGLPSRHSAPSLNLLGKTLDPIEEESEPLMISLSP
mmetsp:Transcript_8358/g.16211  ORF Transcript_8358/g.16211 Transcript_8358/m.16211 type:complete len:146 (-) Transcript_8358:472-909(-)